MSQDTDTTSPPVPQPPIGFHKLVNQHGYGFQHAVIREANRLADDHRSRWIFEVAEFPVSIRGVDTRIDFILRHRDRPLYLVAECKRAKPEFAHWCFLRAPYTRRNSGSHSILVEQLGWGPDHEMRSVEVAELGYTSDAYQIGLEGRTPAPGEGPGRGRGAIDEAAAQVIRGVNGLIENFGRAHVNEEARFLIPVVFTTANLWTSDVDLGGAALSSGEVRAEDVQLLPKAWVAYQFASSESLKHEIARRLPLEDDLSSVLKSEYMRTVQYVNWRGISGFLSYLADI